jgi:hypothetical protein
MKRKTAGILFVSICAMLAILLLVKIIIPLIGGIIFAAALVLIGILSKGFRAK